MSEIIKLILSLSLSGSILAVIIFTLKPLIKNRLSKSIQYYIWLVVLIRLIMPFSFETSIMNRAFYKDNTKTEITVPIGMNNTTQPIQNITPAAKTQEKASNEFKVQATTSKKSLNVIAFLRNNLIYIWLIGALIALLGDIFGYARFLEHMRKSNKKAEEKEIELLSKLLRKNDRVKLVRNKYAPTPMLIGIIKPCIIIPDIDFTDNQLKNILLHEITHMHVFDIGIKWLMTIAASIHWFNPLMYFIKKEINRACELSCDEGVIKNLSDEEKQGYGDTLISMVAEHKYSIGILSTTMCEEKRTLKERLLSIMKHSKKSRLITIASAILIIMIVCISLVLGAGVGITNRKPPNIYISTESGKTKDAIRGGYHWRFGNEYILTDTDHPNKFKYESQNIVSLSSGEKLIVSTQKLKSNKKYNFTLGTVEVYENGRLIEFDANDISYANGTLYLQVPKESGEYIYSLWLNYKNRGKANYGFVVRVDLPTYDLAAIKEYRTPYIGNHVKVGNIIGLLPLPSKYFKQQYMSMITSTKPYSLTVYYEGITNSSTSSDDPAYAYMQKNALVLFCMIDNLEEVNFAFRDTPSTGTLDTSKYITRFTSSRESIEYEFGDINKLSKDMDLLSDALKDKKPVSTEDINKLISVIMSSPMESSNPADYIAAHKTEYDTIVNMKEEALTYLCSILNGGEWELKGNIVQRICTDIVKELNKNGNTSAKREKLIEETNNTIKNRGLVIEYYTSHGISPNGHLPEFTKEEVASARAVVEEYYRAILAKDDKAILATLHENRRANVQLYGEEKRTLLKIDYDSQDLKRRNYRPNNIAFTPDKVIVFKVSFNIEYPNGIGGPWNPGAYDNWSMILIRENEKSPWFIYDQGY